MTNIIKATVTTANGAVTTHGYDFTTPIDCGPAVRGDNYYRRIGVVDVLLMPGNIRFTTEGRRQDLYVYTTDKPEEILEKVLPLVDELGANKINLHYLEGDTIGYETARLLGGVLAAAQAYKNGEHNAWALAQLVQKFECAMDIENTGATALIEAQRVQQVCNERQLRAYGGPDEGHYLNYGMSDKEVVARVKEARATQSSLQHAWQIGMMSHEIGKAMVTEEATVMPLIRQMVEFMETRPPVAAGPQVHQNTRQLA